VLQEARETAEFGSLENDSDARVRRAIERKK
jgi:hypothetical protein